MGKSLSKIENIYKEIAEEKKKLCEDFLRISIETIKNEPTRGCCKKDEGKKN
jgi:hypothetical protein